MLHQVPYLQGIFFISYFTVVESEGIKHMSLCEYGSLYKENICGMHTFDMIPNAALVIKSPLC